MAQLVVNGHNLGTDLQTCILQVSSGPLAGSYPVEQLGHLRELRTAGEVTPNTITPVIYSGLRLHRNIYHDWAGSLHFERYNGNLVSLWNSVMQNFQSSGQETYFAIYATIFNSVLNTFDEYLWNQCVTHMDNGGAFNGTSAVEQGLAFRCQTMTLVGNSNSIV